MQFQSRLLSQSRRRKWIEPFWIALLFGRQSASFTYSTLYNSRLQAVDCDGTQRNLQRFTDLSMPSTRQSRRIAAAAASNDSADIGGNEKNTVVKDNESLPPTELPVAKKASKAKTGEKSKRKAKDATDKENVEKVAKKKKGSAASAPSTDKIAENTTTEKTTKKTKASKARSTATKSKDKSVVDDSKLLQNDASPSSSSPKGKAKVPKHQVITEQTPLERKWKSQDHPESYTFRIGTWNVAGLRAVIRNNPKALDELAAKHKLDMLCLQEIKLQESHIDDPNIGIGEVMDGYDSYYSCSTTKKGYSGTAVYIKKRKGVKGVVSGVAVSSSSKDKSVKSAKLTSFFAKKDKDHTDTDSAADIAKSAGDTGSDNDEQLPVDVTLLIPERVYYAMNSDKHDSEGRTVFVDFPWATICNVYVPNAGQGLVRLSYRVDEWDKDFLGYLQAKQKERQVPVMWLGDLNVAHTNLEVWNDGAKHLSKQAGITPEERASFQAQLDSGFVDAFRQLYPTAQGHYTYWSQRAGNRAPNKGLRLDYFICHSDLFDSSAQATVRDSYMDPDWLGSDHCPAIIEIELKKVD